MIRSEVKVLMAQMTVKQGRRITYDVLHENTGLARSTLAALATGQSKMVSLETLDLLCKFFDCKVGDILAYVPDDAQSDA